MKTMLITDLIAIGSKRTYSDEGFLQVPAKISRTGIQTYFAVEMGLTDREPTDVIRVYRPKEEVFSDVSLSSFASKPVTDNHPPEMVTAANSNQYSVGLSSPTVEAVDKFVETVLNVIVDTAIKKIESGKVELSNGYTADIDWTPGISEDGEQYDCVQRNIRGNHIAIVEKGRAGPACRVADELPTQKEDVMKITIDGVDFEVTEQVGQAVTKLQTRVSDAEESAEKEKEKVKSKEDEAEEAEKKAKKTEDSLQAKLDSALANAPDEKAIRKLVVARSALVDSAQKLCPKTDFADMDSSAIKVAAITAASPTADLEGKSSDYIDARFDTLVETFDANSQNTLDNVFRTNVIDKKKQDGDKDDRPPSIIARDKMIERNKNAYKKTEAAK